MGLIKAAFGATGGTLADQWKEFFYCDALDSDILVDHTERNRRWRPKFIADQLLNVEIIDPLVFPSVAAVGYPIGDCPQGVAEIRIKIAGK